MFMKLSRSYGRVAGIAGALALVGAGALAPSTPADARPAAASHKLHDLCASPKAHHAKCFAVQNVSVTEPEALRHIMTPRPGAAPHVVPNATPYGYGPTDLRNAYNLLASGSGNQTVAVVDAYDNPNAEADLAVYRSQYGLPACTTANGCFSKVNQTGTTAPLPAPNASWAGEIALDVDMVSAICPSCHILLVEANDAGFGNLGAAENTAVKLGAKFVSNSWGGGEWSGETGADSYFNHPGVAITVSSGDDDFQGAEYPAASPYVTAVGGTSLRRDASARGWNEKVWNSDPTNNTEGAGSGCSLYEAKPVFQNGVATSCGKRAESDVSAVADPSTGVAVYNGGWGVYGGTSASAPIIAAVYALAGTPGATDSPNSYPYNHTANLNDVTTGNNGTCGAPICSAGAGWDGPTGLGTPNGTAAFAAAAPTPPPVANTVTVTNPGNQTSTVGTSVSLQVKATDSSATEKLTYTAKGLPAGLSIDAATGLISGTPTAATSTQYVGVTATDSTGATDATTFAWTVNAAPVACASAQLLTNGGFESGSTAWTATAGVIQGDGAYAYTGKGYAWLDGYRAAHTDSVSQTVTVPAGCKAYLNYHLKIGTLQTGTTAVDKMTVTVNGTQVQQFSNRDASAGRYLYTGVDLSSYAGKTVTIKWTGVQAGATTTSFYVDDATLYVTK